MKRFVCRRNTFCILILLFKAIYRWVAWFCVGTILCPFNWKTHKTLLRLALSYWTSDYTGNMSFNKKGDSRMALGVEGVQSRRVLWFFPWFVWWCAIWHCLAAKALAFHWPMLAISDSALRAFGRVDPIKVCVDSTIVWNKFIVDYAIKFPPDA